MTKHAAWRVPKGMLNKNGLYLFIAMLLLFCNGGCLWEPCSGYVAPEAKSGRYELGLQDGSLHEDFYDPESAVTMVVDLKQKVVTVTYASPTTNVVEVWEIVDAPTEG